MIVSTQLTHVSRYKHKDKNITIYDTFIIVYTCGGIHIEGRKHDSLYKTHICGYREGG
jgi:hypothetical protein